MITSFRTSVHGRCIELPWDLALPEGHVIEVTIKTYPEVESLQEPPLPWLERFVVDPAVMPGKFVIKGTRVGVDALVELVQQGKSDEDLTTAHSELSAEDLAAVREYAKVPVGIRQSFGGWADDGKDLDSYLEWTRLHRMGRRGLED